MLWFNIPASVISATALLGLTVLMLLTGRLVPRAGLRDRVAESERWRLAYEAEREARNLADEQVTELLELARTTHAVITAMAAATERLRGGNNVLQEEKE